MYLKSDTINELKKECCTNCFEKRITKVIKGIDEMVLEVKNQAIENGVGFNEKALMTPNQLIGIISSIRDRLNKEIKDKERNGG